MKAQECFREALSLDPHHVQRCCVLLVGDVPHTTAWGLQCSFVPPCPQLAALWDCGSHAAAL